VSAADRRIEVLNESNASKGDLLIAISHIECPKLTYCYVIDVRCSFVKVMSGTYLGYIGIDNPADENDVKVLTTWSTA